MATWLLQSVGSKNLKWVQPLQGGSTSSVWLAERQDCLEVIKSHSGGVHHRGVKKLKLEAEQLRALQFLKQEYDWRLCFPKVLWSMETTEGFVLALEYMPGLPLAKITTEAEPRGSELSNLLRSLKEAWQSAEVAAPPNFFNTHFVERPKARIAEALRRVNDSSEGALLSSLLEQKTFRLNGRAVLSPLLVLEELVANISPKMKNLQLAPCVSGDLIPDNIIFNGSNNPVLIDPRGYCYDSKLHGRILPWFLPEFDLAKLIFSFLAWRPIMDNDFAISGNRGHGFDLTLGAASSFSMHWLRSALSECSALYHDGWRSSLDPQELILFLIAGNFLADIGSRVQHGTPGEFRMAVALYLCSALVFDVLRAYRGTNSLELLWIIAEELRSGSSVCSARSLV